MTIKATLASFSVFSGDSKQLVITVYDEAGAVLDLTGASVVWKMAANVRSYPFLEKDAALLGGVTIAGTPATATVALDSSDTQLPAGDYYHEARITIDDVRSTVVAAKATVLPTLPA